MTKIKIKRGSWSGEVEGVGLVALRFRRPSTAERLRMAATVGRASSQIVRYWTTYIEIDEANKAAVASNDEAARLAALRRVEEMNELLEPDVWEAVAELLAEFCAEARLDGEAVGADDVPELMSYIPATDAYTALKNMVHAEEGLSEVEGKRSASTSAT